MLSQRNTCHFTNPLQHSYIFFCSFYVKLIHFRSDMIIWYLFCFKSNKEKGNKKYLEHINIFFNFIRGWFLLLQDWNKNYIVKREITFHWNSHRRTRDRACIHRNARTIQLVFHFDGRKSRWTWAESLISKPIDICAWTSFENKFIDE